MTATTTDGVEVEIRSHEWKDGPPTVEVCAGAFGFWRETDRPTVDAAAAWVSLLTWDDVRLGCL